MVSRTSPVAEQIDAILNNKVLNFTVVNGAAAATKIVSVVKLDFTLAEGAPNTRTWEASDLTSEASITSAGNIQLSTTDTSNEVLLVFWLDIT